VLFRVDRKNYCCTWFYLSITCTCSIPNSPSRQPRSPESPANPVWATCNPLLWTLPLLWAVSGIRPQYTEPASRNSYEYISRCYEFSWRKIHPRKTPLSKWISAEFPGSDPRTYLYVVCIRARKNMQINTIGTQLFGRLCWETGPLTVANPII